MEQPEPNQPPAPEREYLHHGTWMTESQLWAAAYAAADWRDREKWRLLAALLVNLFVPLLLLVAAELAMLHGPAWLPDYGGRWHLAAIKVALGWMFVRFSEWMFRDLIEDVRYILAPADPDDDGW